MILLIQDFEKLGVFDAQTELEKIQKVEEDHLYQHIMEKRKRTLRKLDEDLQKEKEKSVKELVVTLERVSPQNNQTGVARETEKLEEHYKRKRAEKVRKLMERLTSEEKQQVARMIEKHSQEMLLMIAERLSTNDVSA